MKWLDKILDWLERSDEPTQEPHIAITQPQDNMPPTEFRYEIEVYSKNLLRLLAIINGRKELVYELYNCQTDDYGFRKTTLHEMLLIINTSYDKHDNEFTRFMSTYNTLTKYLEYKNNLNTQYDLAKKQYKQKVKEFETKNGLT